MPSRPRPSRSRHACSDQSRSGARPEAGSPSGLRILVTAGPTHEPIDAVRYLANRSSGRMGIAIANAAADHGCAVTLLLGPIPDPGGCPVDSKVVIDRFHSTSDLAERVQTYAPAADVVVMAAAVADFRPAAGSTPGKLERGSRLTLTLEPTPDILAGLARDAAAGQILVGFALEPADELLGRARAKLERKGVDAIVANALETMDAATVSATLLWRDGSADAAPPDMAKERFGRWLVERLLAARHAPNH